MAASLGETSERLRREIRTWQSSVRKHDAAARELLDYGRPIFDLFMAICYNNESAADRLPAHSKRDPE